MPSELRHHLSLTIKESCHNILRHAGPCEGLVKLRYSNNQLTIKISDTGRGFDERFNRGMIVDHGWTHVRIPIEQIRQGPVARELDLRAITRVLFFARTGPSRRFLLDDVRLGD